jgi:geranylgeranyl diphosphate synthase, type II
LENYKHIFNSFEDYLKDFQKKLPTKPAHLYESQSYILDLGGKRLRPLLVLIANDLFHGNQRKALPAALCIELFHNFSLMHDDIMDEAPLRRKQPTVHTKWNIHTAILGGDAMLVKCYESLILSDTDRKEELIQLFNKTALEVCEGQQLDMNFEEEGLISIDDYLEMIKLKTAVLLGCSLKMGAIIANANNNDAERIYQFGIHAGLVFQLQDDYLDTYGETENTGKQKGGDILACKKTILFIDTYMQANEEDKIRLLEFFDKKAPQQNNKVEQVMALFTKYKAEEHLKTKINFHHEKAVEALHAITSIEEDKKAVFLTFIESLTQRQA